MPKLSVIIPVYNVERYLSKCLDSISAQYFEDFEAILVNDGSTDGSREICREYVKKDKRFKLLDQINSGVSRARNEGLKIAKGDFITFVDSDDYIEPYTFSTYIEAFNNYDVDMVKVGYYVEDECRIQSTIGISSDLFVDTTWDLHYNLEANKYYNFVWNLCIKRWCIRTIHFDEKINWLEDQIFSFYCYTNCNKMLISSKVCYHYMVRKREERLSFIRNPWVISEASRLSFELKRTLNKGYYCTMDKSAEDDYMYNLHRLVLVLYRFDFSYKVRKSFIKIPLYNNKPFYKEEIIFFNNIIPFLFRDIILKLLTMFRKLNEG